MRRTRRALFALTMLFVAPLVGGPALALCPGGQRQAGEIVSPREQMIAVERAGERTSISSLESLCTGDRIIARDIEVTVQLQWQETPTQIERGSQFTVPSRRQVQLDLLSGLASFFFQREARAGESAVTLAPPQIRFASAGLINGEARLSAMPSSFVPPVSRSESQDLTVRLRPPKGAPIVQTARAGEPTPAFGSLPRQGGAWVIEAESAGIAIRGSFLLEGTSTWRGPRAPEDGILLWICEDPPRNTLQGIHELREANGGTVSARAQAILTRWNEPGSRSFCAAE